MARRSTPAACELAVSPAAPQIGFRAAGAEMPRVGVVRRGLGSRRARWR